MRICVSVSMCHCLYGCVYVCICVCLYVFQCVRMSLCVGVWRCIFICFRSLWLCVYLSVSVVLYVGVRAYVYNKIHKHAHFDLKCFLKLEAVVEYNRKLTIDTRSGLLINIPSLFRISDGENIKKEIHCSNYWTKEFLHSKYLSVTIQLKRNRSCYLQSFALSGKKKKKKIRTPTENRTY